MNSMSEYKPEEGRRIRIMYAIDGVIRFKEGKFENFIYLSVMGQSTKYIGFIRIIENSPLYTSRILVPKNSVWMYL